MEASFFCLFIQVWNSSVTPPLIYRTILPSQEYCLTDCTPGGKLSDHSVRLASVTVGVA